MKKTVGMWQLNLTQFVSFCQGINLNYDPHTIDMVHNPIGIKMFIFYQYEPVQLLYKKIYYRILQNK